MTGESLVEMVQGNDENLESQSNEISPNEEVVIVSGESLAEMVQEPETEGNRISIDDIDFNENEEVITNEVVEEIPNEENPIDKIHVTTFNEWFGQNFSRFVDVSLVRVSSAGVDSNETIVVKVPDPKGGETEDGITKCKLRIFDEADISPALDLPGDSMRAFNGAYETFYEEQDEMVVKGYGIKAGMIIVFNKKIDDLVIPYFTTRIKRKDTEVDIVIPPESLQEKLNENVNLETVILLYKPIEKFTDGLVTIKDVVIWLTNKQKEVWDVNHLHKIDNVIIKLLTD